MSVDYRAVIIVGLPKDELGLEYNEIEDAGLEFVPRYYDAQDGIVGIVVCESGDYSYEEIAPDLTDAICQADKTFTDATGKDGKLYLSTQGY